MKILEQQPQGTHVFRKQPGKLPIQIITRPTRLDPRQSQESQESQSDAAAPAFLQMVFQGILRISYDDPHVGGLSQLSKGKALKTSCRAVEAQLAGHPIGIGIPQCLSGQWV